ncbi:MAG: hypothetical protein AB7E79_16550 [Rhodospirillaceae bacterium]
MTDAGAFDATYNMVPAVTTEQLECAVARALAAAGPFGTPRATDAASLSKDAGGPFGALTGEAAARMAAAIADAFPVETAEQEQLLKGLIWRGIFAFSDVVGDARFGAFGENAQSAFTVDNFTVDKALLAAMASTPMPFGGDVPLDAIFAQAVEHQVQ